MDRLRRVTGFLVDLAVILTLGIIYVLALSVGTVWEMCSTLINSLRAAVSGPRYSATDEDATLSTRCHDPGGETEN